MYPGDRSRVGQPAANLPPAWHVCPLQGGDEPGTGMSGNSAHDLLTCVATLFFK